MKPNKTWILLANSREASVLSHDGPGKGLSLLADKTWKADPAIEFSDRAGMGHSSHGPGVSAVDQGDPQEHADAAFAKKVLSSIHDDLRAGKFNRLVLAAGPHMLGLLRKAIPEDLQHVLLAEIDKDLSAAPKATVETNLAEILPV
jgi:protein required for attachment to host cells